MDLPPYPFIAVAFAPHGITLRGGDAAETFSWDQHQMTMGDGLQASLGRQWLTLEMRCLAKHLFYQCMKRMGRMKPSGALPKMGSCLP
jgi:hypothetical protein